jgi:nucleotide-binding universal stress UspA family protein
VAAVGRAADAGVVIAAAQVAAAADPVADVVVQAEAAVVQADLVVIGAHKAEGWLRFLLDDLAHEIITHADRPVLIV